MATSPPPSPSPDSKAHLLKSLDLAQSFRQRLIDTVMASSGLQQRINILSTTWSATCFAAVFKFHARVSPDDVSLSAHSSLVFWINHLLQSLTLKATRLPRYLTDQVFNFDHFVWEVPGKGYVLLEPSGALSASGTRPDWTLSFLPADSPRMAWRLDQLKRVSNSMDMLRSFEFDSGTGAVKRQPSEQAYLSALSELRTLLRAAGMVS